MSVQMVLLPVFVLVFLMFVLGLRVMAVRWRAVKTREVRVRDIALGQNAWPENVTKVSNSYGNQFELPLLYFVLVALALPLRQTDLLFVLLSWIFVVLRFVHSGVHVTSNDLRWRFSAFMAGAVVLMAMWIYFALKLFLAI